MLLRSPVDLVQNIREIAPAEHRDANIDQGLRYRGDRSGNDSSADVNDVGEDNGGAAADPQTFAANMNDEGGRAIVVEANFDLFFVIQVG